MNSTALLQVVPTTCYRAASQQLVNMLWVTNLVQLDKITALLQLVDKLVTSLLRAQLVDKMSVLPCVQSFQSYTRKNAQLVTNLQQTCSKLVGTSLLRDLFALFVPSLLTSCYKSAADLLQAWWTQQPCYKFVPTACYRAASQQLVNMLWVTNLVQLDKITALLQLVDKLVTSLLRAQLVDKMCVLPCVQCSQSYTRKTAQLVTNLQQTCSKPVGTSLLQDLFALFLPSLLTSCYKSAADLLQAWWTQQPCL